MKLKLLRTPPDLALKRSWRELYEDRLFMQRELIGESRLRSVAKERDYSLGIGTGALEDLDECTAFRPIAFAEDGYWTGFVEPAIPSDLMVFKDEREPRSWREHQWESEMEPGLPNLTPLFSAWQLIYVDDVLSGTDSGLSLETMLLEGDERDAALQSLRPFAEQQNSAWRDLDRAWSPLIKLLVSLQNNYWPKVGGRLAVVPTQDGEGYRVSGPDPRRLPPQALLDQLGISVPEVLAAYHYLLERGLERDPRDGLTLLRRARPRAFQLLWRGLPRRAQDNFDAAEVLRLFLFDLAGKQPPRPGLWPIDGRQQERSALYERGPGGDWKAEEIKAALLAAELYPHGVHIIGEGPGEGVMVERLVTALVGSGPLEELEFFNLGGSGGASYVEALATAFGDYAARALVIADREGKMAEYLRGAIGRGVIKPEDVMLFDRSLEQSNATAAELIDLAREIAGGLVEDPTSVAFKLEPAELELLHASHIRRSSRGGEVGLAEFLLGELNKRTCGALKIDKLVFATALADKLARELTEAEASELEALKARRPIVGFVIDQVIEALNRPRPAGSSP